MKVKIYKPTKTASQSGTKKFNRWILEFPKHSSLNFEPLMGWNKSDNTKKQVQLYFDNFDQVLDYVQKNNLNYILIPSKEKKFKIRSYSDNFKNNRVK